MEWLAVAVFLLAIPDLVYPLDMKQYEKSAKECGIPLRGKLPLKPENALKCKLHCLLQKINVISQENKIVSRTVVELIENARKGVKKKIAKTLQTCEAIVDKNKCELAFKFHKCMSS